jgi:hypothetical protein
MKKFIYYILSCITPFVAFGIMSLWDMEKITFSPCIILIIILFIIECYALKKLDI